MTAKDLISVNFRNEEIRTILRNVADLFELNLCVPLELQGRMTIKIRNATWRQVFRKVLVPAGYAFEEDGNIVNVINVSAHPNTRVVHLNMDPKP